MANVYEVATRIMRNIKLTSDNVNMEDCYSLCANKQYIEELKTNDHQVIWGRRGTGKTTLLKAFTHDINFVDQEPSTIAIYIVMAHTIPTEDEINSISGDGSSLAVYVFSKLISEICNELEKNYYIRQGAMESDCEDKFLNAFFGLRDYLTVYQTSLKGGEISVDSLKSDEVKQALGYEIGAEIKPHIQAFSGLSKIFKKKGSQRSQKEVFEVKGILQFKLETRVISEYILQMLDALKISLVYICLDEYSEVDKVSEISIQSKVAQLIKQVFFKKPMYSVKIATIWNQSKLHQRGGNRVEGIEYQQDIFAGPDLDIMFMENNAEIINYFKELLINTYLIDGVDENTSDKERNALSNYIVTDIFGDSGLRHIICGSQGVSRAFAVLAKKYLHIFIKNGAGRVKLGDVYDIIKHHYLEDVRSKIPYFTLYKAVDTYVTDNLCRYFLVKREDYQRCNALIKYLSSRGVFMQIPGQLTDKKIRDEYKLFVIHYGSYLDALESYSYRKGRKKLDEDSKLEANGMLVPEYSPKLINTPASYTVSIPEGCETEVYCTECNKMFNSVETGNRVRCPYCNHSMLRFIEFVDDVSL